jgi:Holliday junction resolvase RusA-like endonuclease
MIAFTVYGNPVPKQSFQYAANGHGYTAPHVKAWQEAVGWAAKIAMGDAEPLTVPLVADLFFVMPNHRRCDNDNLSKCCLDGMNSIVYADDSQITDLFIHRRVGGEPGVGIKVWRVGREGE